MIKNFKGKFFPVTVDLQGDFIKYYCNFEYSGGFKSQRVILGKHSGAGINNFIKETILSAIQQVYSDLEDVLSEESKVKFKNPHILKLKYTESNNIFLVKWKLSDDEKEYEIAYDVEEGIIESEDIKLYFDYDKNEIPEDEVEEKALHFLTNYLYGIFDVIFDCGFELTSKEISLFNIKKIDRKVVFFYSCDFYVIYSQTNPETGEEEEYFKGDLSSASLCSESPHLWEQFFLVMSELELGQVYKLIRTYRDIELEKTAFRVHGYENAFDLIKFEDGKQKTRISKDMFKLKRLLKDFIA